MIAVLGPGRSILSMLASVNLSFAHTISIRAQNWEVDPIEEHAAAFLVGKISQVERDSPNESNEMRYSQNLRFRTRSYSEKTWVNWLIQ
jgi:hypothetical protein